MAEHRVERRLAAILAADVAGYSRLMGLDEEGTLARLKAHRCDLIDPKIAEHRGRIVKTTGDGVLVEFASVVDAVRCALDIQSGMIPRNADVAGAKRVEFRIGINVGDIITEDQDVSRASTQSESDGRVVLERVGAPCRWRVGCRDRSFCARQAPQPIRPDVVFDAIWGWNRSFPNWSQ